jgi:hypothetical protein
MGLAVCIVILGTMSCGAETNPHTGEETFSAVINGSPWVSSGALASYANPVVGILGGDGRLSVQLSFYATAPGTFALASAMVQDNLGHVWIGDSGSVTVTIITANRVAGTFTFNVPALEGTGNMRATNGRFDVLLH